MENCFEKTFKGIVNDDTLSRIGEIKIELSGDSSQNLNLSVAAAGNYYIRAVGDCAIYNPTGTTSWGKNYEFAGTIEYSLKGRGLIFIKEGYESTELNISNNQSFDIEQVLVRPLLKTLKAQNSVIQGDLDAALKGTTILEKLYLNGAVCDEYNITSVCGNTNINEFLVGNAKGKLEDFVEGLLSNGRASGSISMSLWGSKVTINNAEFTPNERLTVTFNSATSVVVTRTTGSAVMATYSNGTWSY
jgi:hypothetical protein